MRLSKLFNRFGMLCAAPLPLAASAALDGAAFAALAGSWKRWLSTDWPPGFKLARARRSKLTCQKRLSDPSVGRAERRPHARVKAWRG